MSRRGWAFATLIAALAAAALIWAFTPTPLAVNTGQVTRGLFVLTVDDDGVTRVRDRYTLTAPVTGMLLRPRVQEGDEVQRDQIVATIIPSAPELLDPRTRAELTARRDAASARSSRAQALERQANAALRQAQFDARRIDELSKEGYVSKTELDQSLLTLDLRRRDFEAARFEVQAAAHDFEEARAAVSRLQEIRHDAGDPSAAWPLRAPVSGRILTVAQESGGPVTVGGTILEIGDVSELEAAIDVLSTEAIRINPGAPVTLDAGNKITFSGRVRTVEPEAHTKISALGIEEQRVNVIVDVTPGAALAARLGDQYRVDARIEIARVPDAIRAPTAALFRDGPAWAVFVISNNKAYKRHIEIGLRNADYAVVTRGLAVGDAVVIYPGDALSDRRRVKVLTQ